MIPAALKLVTPDESQSSCNHLDDSLQETGCPLCAHPTLIDIDNQRNFCTHCGLTVDKSRLTYEE